MQHFLRMPQFSAEPRLFSNYIINPLMDPAGPHPGAVQALSQVMQSVMIRHRYVAIYTQSQRASRPYIGVTQNRRRRIRHPVAVS